LRHRSWHQRQYDFAPDSLWMARTTRLAGSRDQSWRVLCVTLASLSQRSVDDPILSGYGQSFRREMLAESRRGSLYVDTLTIGLVLHLLSTYGVARPKVPAPRFKLNSYQLRSV